MEKMVIIKAEYIEMVRDKLQNISNRYEELRQRRPSGAVHIGKEAALCGEIKKRGTKTCSARKQWRRSRNDDCFSRQIQKKTDVAR